MKHSSAALNAFTAKLLTCPSNLLTIACKFSISLFSIKKSYQVQPDNCLTRDLLFKEAVACFSWVLKGRSGQVANWPLIFISSAEN